MTRSLAAQPIGAARMITPRLTAVIGAIALVVLAVLLFVTGNSGWEQPAPVPATDTPRPSTTREGLSPADRSAATTGPTPRPETTR